MPCPRNAKSSTYLKLLLRVDNKEQTISELTSENDGLTASLNAAESRLAEVYAEQARMEEEASSRLDLVEMLRSQVLELERDNRDVIRRYNEQVCVKIQIISCTTY